MEKQPDIDPCPGGPHLPPDAERLGLTSLTAPGVAFAASLTSSHRRPMNRVMAWMAAVIIGVPVLFAIVVMAIYSLR